MDTTRSDLTKALVRAGLRKATAPTVTERGIKEPGAAKNGAHRQLPTKGQEGEALLHGGGIRLVWSNPTLRQSVKHTPSLKLVCSR